MHVVDRHREVEPQQRVVRHPHQGLRLSVGSRTGLDQRPRIRIALGDHAAKGCGDARITDQGLILVGISFGGGNRSLGGRVAGFSRVQILLRDEVRVILVYGDETRVRQVRIAVVGLRAPVGGERVIAIIAQLRHFQNRQQLSCLDAIADVHLHLLHVAGHLRVHLDFHVGPELRREIDFPEQVRACDAGHRHDRRARRIHRCRPAVPGARNQDAADDRDYEDAQAPALVHGVGSRARGCLTRKVLPLPGALVTSTTAPCAVQIDFTIDRPRPAPPCSREREPSTR